MFENTFAYISFNNGKEKKLKIYNGSCPGGILSPLLLIISV